MKEEDYKEMLFASRVICLIVLFSVVLYMFPAVVMLAVISFILLLLFTVWFVVGLSRRYNKSLEEYDDLDS